MQIIIRKIGNSKGVVLPKPLLAQVGLDQDSVASVSVQDDAIVLRKLTKNSRAGWAQDAQAVAAADDDALLMGEFGNTDDADLTW